MDVKRENYAIGVVFKDNSTEVGCLFGAYLRLIAKLEHQAMNYNSILLKTYAKVD